MGKVDTNEQEQKITNKEYRAYLKEEKARKIAYSKAKDKAWRKLIRNLDYEDIKAENKDDIVLQPRKIGKLLVK